MLTIHFRIVFFSIFLRPFIYRYDVTGYPTVKYFPPGSTVPVDYQGGREVEPMLDYINVNAGTYRTLSGELTEMAGRIKSLDDVILAVEKIDAAAIASMKEAVAAVADSKAAAHAKEYLSMAEKIAAKGVEFVEKEIARLTGMIGSSSVSADKKTGFMIRKNILNAFKKTEKN